MKKTKELIILKESLLDSVLSDIFTMSLALLIAYIDTKYIHSAFLKTFIYIVFAICLLSSIKKSTRIAKSEGEAIEMVKNFYRKINKKRR